MMRVPPIALDGAVDRIRDPALREAARRHEAETGERLADAFGAPLDEGLLGVYLIVLGRFRPEAAGNDTKAEAPEETDE